jgi:hypothetical protein
MVGLKQGEGGALAACGTRITNREWLLATLLPRLFDGGVMSWAKGSVTAWYGHRKLGAVMSLMQDARFCCVCLSNARPKTGYAAQQCIRCQGIG